MSKSIRGRDSRQLTLWSPVFEISARRDESGMPSVAHKRGTTPQWPKVRTSRRAGLLFGRNCVVHHLRNTLSRPLKNKSGFMMFEAIMAVAILSLGLVLVLRSFTSSLQAAKVSRNYMQAALLLEEKIGQIEKTGIFPAGKLSGEEENFTWEIEALPLDEGDEEETEEKISLNKVYFSLSWFEGKRKKGVSLSTYLINGETKESEN